MPLWSTAFRHGSIWEGLLTISSFIRRQLNTTAMLRIWPRFSLMMIHWPVSSYPWEPSTVRRRTGPGPVSVMRRLWLLSIWLKGHAFCLRSWRGWAAPAASRVSTIRPRYATPASWRCSTQGTKKGGWRLQATWQSSARFKAIWKRRRSCIRPF